MAFDVNVESVPLDVIGIVSAIASFAVAIAAITAIILAENRYNQDKRIRKQERVDDKRERFLDEIQPWAESIAEVQWFNDTHQSSKETPKYNDKPEGFEQWSLENQQEWNIKFLENQLEEIFRESMVKWEAASLRGIMVEKYAKKVDTKLFELVKELNILIKGYSIHLMTDHNPELGKGEFAVSDVSFIHKKAVEIRDLCVILR